MSNNIKRNFLYNSFLTTAGYIFSLLTFPYVSRVLGVEKIGICNFVDSIISYYSMFAMMGIAIIGVREIARDKNDKEKLNRTFNSIFWLNATTTIFISIILLISIYVIPQFFIYRRLLFIGLLKLLFNCLLIEWFFRGLEDFKYITIRSLFIKVLYTISIFIFIRDTSDYVIYYLLTSLMFVGNAAFNFIYSRRFVYFSYKGVSFSQYIKPNIIYGVYYLISSLYITFNIVYLGFVASVKDVGYYTTATKLYGIFLAFYTAFTGVMSPRMSNLIGEGLYEQFKSLLHKSMNILFTCSVPVIMYVVVNAPYVIQLLAGRGYEGAIIPMRIVMCLMLIVGYEQILIVQGLTPLKKDKAVLTNSIFGTLVSIVLNVFLVHSLKSIGSSIALVASELSVLISAQYFLGKYIGARFPWKILFFNVVKYAPLLALIYLLYIYIDNYILELVIAAMLLCLYFLVVNCYLIKDEIIYQTCQSIKNRFIKYI